MLPEPPVVYVDRTQSTSPEWAEAFSAGCGGMITDDTVLGPGDMALFGSGNLWPMLREARRKRRNFYYGDHAYFGRGTWYRCTRNGIQHSGAGHALPFRFLAHGLQVKPWRRSGDHILICLQSPDHYEVHGQNRDKWLADVLAQISRVTDRKVRLRGHEPLPKNPLANDLKDCWALVTYTSNAAVEALLEGIPVFCTGECPALRMGMSELEHIEYPRWPDGRDQLMWNLAENQWTLDEYRSGMAWRKMNEHIAG